MSEIIYHSSELVIVKFVRDQKLHFQLNTKNHRYIQISGETAKRLISELKEELELIEYLESD